ncbi:hypothetical protein CXG81DRAFT_23994 [Caulochytrium protostelioides]|uniref:heme oxygenase (biliverdin-producing) n=1 Tax=Caulochytrium protostelioides TaxID=1555241 RepID=A0A4P9XD00_9FUNG|nr:hypothetical protein CXG81DRAFT_23994 [Caulochytrium protostelioides]|eukprot:RKP03338.1 hypothetical protein CXG81DRAFT_23994 [Caulochytrium protostelioides]
MTLTNAAPSVELAADGGVVPAAAAAAAATRKPLPGVLDPQATAVEPAAADAEDTDPHRLATRLRVATAQVHTEAEHAPFVNQLVTGTATRAAITLHYQQLYAVYYTLETALMVARAAAETRRRHADADADADAGARAQATLAAIDLIWFSELWRAPSLKEDLAAVCPDAPLPAPIPVGDSGAVYFNTTPATAAYTRHLAALATAADADAVLAPARLVAHSYVRYLGDLSGGQYLSRKVEKFYGHRPHFYTFEEIPATQIRAFKDRFRAHLNQVDASLHDAIVDEAVHSFRANMALFHELAGPQSILPA